jgi:uncharacterized membrane protein
MYFRRGVVRPIECFSEGWRLIRDQYLLMMGLVLVGLIIASSGPFGLLQGPMMCGIYLCLFTLERGDRVELGMLFKGFDYFLRSFVVTLIQLVPLLLAFIPAFLGMFFFFFALEASRGQGRAAEPMSGPLVAGLMGVGLVFVLLFFVLGVLLLFAYPLIVDQRLSGWDACVTSARAVLGNAGGILVLVLLNLALGCAGLLLCYVGIIPVLPIGFAATAAAYRRIFPESA